MTSRFPRAQETARLALGSRAGAVPHEVDPDLDDIRIGELEGRTLADYRVWKHAHTRADRFPGGESLDEAAARYAARVRAARGAAGGHDPLRVPRDPGALRDQRGGRLRRPGRSRSTTSRTRRRSCSTPHRFGVLPKTFAMRLASAGVACGRLRWSLASDRRGRNSATRAGRDPVHAGLVARVRARGRRSDAQPARTCGASSCSAARGGPTYDGGDEAARAALVYATQRGRRPLTRSGVYYLPLAYPTDVYAPATFALHVADGSQIISRRVDGPSLTIFVGRTGRERYGSCLARTTFATLADGYLPIVETAYTDASGVRVHAGVVRRTDRTARGRSSASSI